MAQKLTAELCRDSQAALDAINYGTLQSFCSCALKASCTLR